MKLVYTNGNRFIVHNVKSIVENSGINVILKNEFAAGGVGELSPFDAWVELWVADDENYKKAVDIIETALNTDSTDEWVCSNCSEKNAASFEVCWKCQTVRP